MKPVNYWKTSDIKVRKDTCGFYTAEHKYQGLLIDSHPFFNSHNDCRREAVKILKDKRAQA